MTVMRGGGLGEHFGNLDDPRRKQGQRHQLLDIIAMTICAVIGGAEGWNDVELFAKSKYEWLRRFLELPNGIPLTPSAGCSPGLAIPGHGLGAQRQPVDPRPSDCLGRQDPFPRPQFGMVSAWASGNFGVGSDQGGLKSRQYPSCLLDVSVIDAMGCQKKIAQQILSGEADYVLRSRKIKEGCWRM